MSLTFGAIQDQTFAWCKQNFPASGASEQLLGVVEELGELAAALGLDERDAAQEQDAIGDLFIYLCNYCSHRQVRLSTFATQYAPECADSILEFEWEAVQIAEKWDQPFLPLAKWVGMLAHANLKNAQQIRGDALLHRSEELTAIGQILVHLAGLCASLGFTLEDAAQEAWWSVEKRDWVAAPLDGLATELATMVEIRSVKETAGLAPPEGVSDRAASPYNTGFPEVRREVPELKGPMDIWSVDRAADFVPARVEKVKNIFHD